ncbi:MAG: 1-acyl-sn-glycerol-3-phosphate acyltransferase [Cyclobacteriaceae bacterium]|nr:1-acyl-sn-glycerol-3-phosphate acyltransferase [Cyclobacteriaceae bacterium]MCH8517293.1 1-acyl-sn-glycerol-3-phosphate acyltransferase [Cyclobacteriaceae bacterium]
MWIILSRFAFWLFGWKLEAGNANNYSKAVMIAAPHTSNWDLFFARAAFFLMRLPVRYTIKKEYMSSVLGGFLRSLGAVGIDRSPKKPGEERRSVVSAMADIIKDNDEMMILVTPEGTRSYVPEWKSGFYYIAMEANVPILLGYLDYEKKVAGVGPAVMPSGNYEEDLEKIQSFYRNIKGKYPEKGVK